MPRSGFTCLIALAVVASTANAIHAQPSMGNIPGGYGVNRPVYSPYLNLLRRDSSAGANYYGLVRPQINAMNSLQSLQGQVLASQQAEKELGASLTLPTTGQQTFFLNNGGYFLNNRSGGGPTTTSLTTRNYNQRIQLPQAPILPQGVIAPGRNR